MKNRTNALSIGLLLWVWLAGGAAIAAESTIPVAVADFDYYDTSGEPTDQQAEHARRMAGFVTILRERLAADGAFTVRELRCGKPDCTAGDLAPDELIKAAREAGARMLVYGGIHKISTLVQWGKVQAVDLDNEALLLDRSFSFRGDNDRAFQRAADFVMQILTTAAPAPAS